LHVYKNILLLEGLLVQFSIAIGVAIIVKVLTEEIVTLHFGIYDSYLVAPFYTITTVDGCRYDVAVFVWH